MYFWRALFAADAVAIELDLISFRRCSKESTYARAQKQRDWIRGARGKEMQGKTYWTIKLWKLKYSSGRTINHCQDGHCSLYISICFKVPISVKLPGGHSPIKFDLLNSVIIISLDVNTRSTRWWESCHSSMQRMPCLCAYSQNLF